MENDLINKIEKNASDVIDINKISAYNLTRLSYERKRLNIVSLNQKLIVCGEQSKSDMGK